MAKKIFLSYRRTDSSGHTELLFDRLGGFYGAASIFRDTHEIRPLDRFREIIQAAISESAILLVVISRQWATTAGADGGPRLSEADDVVRWEIATALSARLPVLPVLVGGATMPSAADLPDDIRDLAGITAHEISDGRWDQDFEELLRIVGRAAPAVKPEEPLLNPFNVRAGIREDAIFQGRTRELNTLRDYIRGQQNCQVVGPRRIGKSSTLLHIQRHCAVWSPQARVAYLDLQDPRCYTLGGWLREVAQGFSLAATPAALPDLMEAIEDLLDAGVRPVLCLDEFGEMARRSQVFSRELFLTLRACGQRGMSIITAAPKRLSELTDPGDDTSPFFNTFPVLPMNPFTVTEAAAFVARKWPGVPPFTESERERILEFAQGLPLALQAACYHVLAARQFGDDMAQALARARSDCGSALGMP
jgi:hypothetical protein